MTIAIMQPYFLPYIGYFQLINVAERFVIYDDVNYITRGWVNRNNILINGAATLISVPLIKPSQNKLIKDIDISTDEKWIGKMLLSIELAYKKAPYFEPVYGIIRQILDQRPVKLVDLNVSLIKAICNHLKITTQIVSTSSIYENTHLSAETRILDICKQERADEYINPIGGQNLYSSGTFASASVKLRFLEAKPCAYKQFNKGFVPNLSIIDLLMFQSSIELSESLTQFEIYG